jgi:hypothetical protein
MRSLCNLNCCQICRALDNITQTRVSKLSSMALKLIEEKLEYQGIVQEFIECYGS